MALALPAVNQSLLIKEAFVASCERGDLNEVAELLGRHRGLSHQAPEALDAAARGGRLGVVQLLVEFGFDPESRKTFRAFELAVKGGHAAIVEFLAPLLSPHPRHEEILDAMPQLSVVMLRSFFDNGLLKTLPRCFFHPHRRKLGDLEAVKLCYEFDPSCFHFDRYLIQNLLENGHESVAEYLMSRCKRAKDLGQILEVAANYQRDTLVSSLLRRNPAIDSLLPALSCAGWNGHISMWSMLLDHVVASASDKSPSVIIGHLLSHACGDTGEARKRLESYIKNPKQRWYRGAARRSLLGQERLLNATVHYLLDNYELSELLLTEQRAAMPALVLRNGDRGRDSEGCDRPEGAGVALKDLLAGDALERAAHSGRLEMLKFILARHSPLQGARDWALKAAVDKLSEECVEFLLAQGANPNANKGVALLVAAKKNFVDSLDLFFAGPIQPDLKYVRQALRIGAKNGFYAFVSKIQALRPEVGIPESGGLSATDRALISASRQAFFETTRRLLFLGGNPFAVPEGRDVPNRRRLMTGTETLLVLAREVLSWERQPGVSVKAAVGNTLGLDPKELGNDAFTKGAPFAGHPIIQTALHSATIAALFFPTHPEKASVALKELLKRDVQRIRETSGLSWSKYVATLSERMKFIDTIQDLVVEVGDSLVLPLEADAYSVRTRTELGVHRYEAFVKAAERLIAGKTTLDFPALNNRWHRPASRIPTRYRPLIGQWYPLFAPQRLSNGITAVPLTSVDQLEAEGDGLNHCVGHGSFAAACQAGYTHIISFRRDQELLATLEIGAGHGSFGRTNDKFREVQFRGYRNGPAPREAHDALTELKQRIAAGDVALNRDRGETVESAGRQRRKVTPLEQYTRIPRVDVEECVRGIEAHYRERVYVQRTNGEKIALL